MADPDTRDAEIAYLRSLLVSARAHLSECGVFGLAWMMDAAVHGEPWRNQLAEQHATEVARLRTMLRNIEIACDGRRHQDDGGFELLGEIREYIQSDGKDPVGKKPL